MILTSAKNNHVAPNNRTLTVAKTKKVRRASYREPKKIVPTTNERKIKNQAGGFSYNPMGRNWPMPPRIMIPPTARLTSRLCNKVFLRSAFKAQKPLRSRAKDCCSRCRAWESKYDRVQGKTKHLSLKLFGDGGGVERRRGGGGQRGSDKHTRYSNSPSCLCPPVLSDLGEIVKRERDRGGAVVCDFIFVEAIWRCCN